MPPARRIPEDLHDLYKIPASPTHDLYGPLFCLRPMKTTLLLALIAGNTLPLFAQEPPSDGPNGHRPPPPPLLVALDTNKDGVISADELAKASDSLKTLDKNSDGQLTKDEFCPKPPPRPQARKDKASGKSESTTQRPPPPSPLVKALDANKDRVIASDEITGASAALATLDKNSDGQLTKDEFAPKPPHRQPHGPKPSSTDTTTAS
jgi:hypothetical protein